MRIVLVTAAPPEVHCGIGDYTTRLATALTELGEDVTVVRGLDWSVFQLPAIRKKVLASNPDVVHVQFPGRGFGRSFAPNLLPWALRGRDRPRLVLTLHEYGIASWRGRLRILLGALGSDAIVYPDEVIAAQVRPALARFGPKIDRVVPVGSNLPAAAPDLDRLAVRERWGIAKDTLTIGWFGLLTREKGAHVLLRALQELRVHQPITLVVIGDVGRQPEARELVDAAGSAGIPSIATGPLPAVDASELLASVDVVALPFAFGLTSRRGSYLAAQAQGAYIVTTHVTRRGYDEASNTYFIAPGDHFGLGSAILEARGGRAGMGPAADAWGAIAATHRELYRAIQALRAP